MMKTARIEAGFLTLRVVDILSLAVFSLPPVLGIESRTYTCWPNTLHRTIPLVFFPSTFKFLRQGITQVGLKLILEPR